MSPSNLSRRESAGYLFKYLLLANFIQYLEAGAVPALLISLSRDFDMDHAQLGLLGGVVYIALSVGGPFAGYLLRQYDHRTVVGYAVVANTVFTLLWAMTPVQCKFSKALFITLRFIMGLAQCFLCVYLPLWINEYAPVNKRTSWMGYLQASVPLGIMCGYIVASIITDISRGSETCIFIMCWRWPFFIEVALLIPLCVVLNSLPQSHFDLYVSKDGRSAYGQVPMTSTSAREPLKQLQILVAQDARTDESRTPSSSSDLKVGSNESPTAENSYNHAAVSAAGSRIVRPTPTTSTTGYQDLSSFPRRSINQSDHIHEFDSNQIEFDRHPKVAEPYDTPRNERVHRHRLRQQAISASLYNVNASKDMMKKSCDDFSNLECGDDLVTLLSGIASTDKPVIETAPGVYWDTQDALMGVAGDGTVPTSLIPDSNDDTLAFVLDSPRQLHTGRSTESSDTWRSIFSNKSPYSSAGALQFMHTPRNSLGDRDSDRAGPDGVDASACSPLLKESKKSPLYGSVLKSSSNQYDEKVHALELQRAVSDGSSVSADGTGFTRRRSLSNGDPNSLKSVGRQATHGHRESQESSNRGSASIKYESLRDASKRFAFKNTLSAMRQQMQMYLKGATLVSGSENPHTMNHIAADNLPRRSQKNAWRYVPSAVSADDEGDSKDDDSYNSALGDESECATEDGSFTSVVINKPPVDTFQPARLSTGACGSSAFQQIPHKQEGASRAGVRLSASALQNVPHLPRLEHFEKSLRSGLRVTIASSSDSESVSDEEWEELSRRIDLDDTMLHLQPTSPIPQLSVASIVCALLRNKVYVFLVSAMAALYFTVTGVQFWGTSYLLLALKAPRPLVNSLFILCAASAPTTGVFFGGWAIDRCGGYKGAQQRVVALELCTLFAVLGCSFATPITFVENIYEAVALLWLVLFCGAAVLPACSGIIVSIVPRHSRPVSSSLSLVIFNLFGYFLSLVLSGLLMQAFSHFRLGCEGACPLIWGFRIVLFWSYWSLLFLLLALFTSYRIVQDRQQAKHAAWLRVVDEAEQGVLVHPTSS